jgi:hypothetical protein
MVRIQMIRRACGIAGAAFYIITASAQPKLEIGGGGSFDLGKIFRGAVVDHQLSIRNTGSDTLRLGSVDVSCGCTGTVVSSDRIPPGGSGSLRITFHSQNFSGPVHKSVTVHSNAEGAPETVIEFTAQVIDEIGLTPQSLLFKNADVKRLNVVTISVSNNGATPLTLTGYRTQMKGLVLKLPREPIPPGGTAEIRAEFTPEAAVSLISEGVFLTTSNERRPEIYIQIFGNAREFSFE